MTAESTKPTFYALEIQERRRANALEASQSPNTVTVATTKDGIRLCSPASLSLLRPAPPVNPPGKEAGSMTRFATTPYPTASWT
ncbi:hypothetical protein GCM10022403_033940 [Streptomyces coacervatus]|uniref:Uncharacterized protein n=1 Tax=Streptomyces coacervatus TaxID=647381 RepID=A0ABP7HJZ4_9ACTN